MPVENVVRAMGDATLARYTREFDTLRLEFTLWNEQPFIVSATGVTRLEDDGTWEADAIIRLPELDKPDGKGLGYGIIDVDDNPTLRFIAENLEL